MTIKKRDEVNRVFVSSTFEDLKDHRASVRDAIRQLGAIDISMENFGARDERPKAECERLIREDADVFVGIYAHRYGFIPHTDDVSITESEYREAIRAGIPVLVYIIDDAHPWPPPQIDSGDTGDKLAVFKAELRTDKVAGSFQGPDHLASAVAADLGRHFSQNESRESGWQGCFHQPPAAWKSPVQGNRWRYKLAAFDLDGTLLRGSAFEFSWEAVWEALGFGKGIQRELKREYRQHNESSSPDSRIEAYRTWCEKACAQFISRRLTRTQMSEIGKSVKLTKHCREGLAELKDAGIVTAIISGGVSTFLEDAFHDYKDYLDFVFINELIFSDSGDLVGVRPTAYDFEGKVDALDFVCKRIGCTPAESVFVGDHFNDEAVMLRAAKAIAYPPQDLITRDASHISIREDDLKLIIPHILAQ